MGLFVLFIVFVIVKDFIVEKYDFFSIKMVMFGVVFFGKEFEDVFCVCLFNVVFG